jgi:hypothetical protein
MAGQDNSFLTDFIGGTKLLDAFRNSFRVKFSGGPYS